MPLEHSIILDLPKFKILKVTGAPKLTFYIKHEEAQKCPHCSNECLRKKESFTRCIRHTLYGQRVSWLELKTHKYQCRRCKKYFNTRLPGIKPRARATEACKLEYTKLHQNGWTQRSLSKDYRLGSATIERWYQSYYQLKNREYENASCPRIMGIDEHFFTKKDGYATTIANLSSHKVFDVVLGRSELALRPTLNKLKGKDRVKVVVMDLS